ncbi:MAG TPA: TetR/AcrR family transcriptional regulator [Ramlibacter sp.]|nr:TetR/AcrR family transcriptional regulator [Ramlibacter sp.]
MSHEKQPRRRAAGRPGSGAAVGKERIVQAALALLREQPPEKLTVVEIASAADVDPALLRYYFGGKKGVLRAAAQTLLADVQERSAEVFGKGGSLRDRIRKRLELLIALHEEHPRFLDLVFNEVYAANEEADAPADVAEIVDRALVLTHTMLGDSPSGADERYLHVAILGVTTFFVRARPLLDQLFPAASHESVKLGYIDFLTDLIAKGLRRTS